MIQQAEFFSISTKKENKKATMTCGTAMIEYCTVYILHYEDVQMCLFEARALFSASGLGSFLVMSAPGHSGSTSKHHGSSVGPGRGPWHIFWGLKVASNGEAL